MNISYQDILRKEQGLKDITEQLNKLFLNSKDWIYSLHKIAEILFPDYYLIQEFEENICEIKSQRHKLGHFIVVYDSEIIIPTKPYQNTKVRLYENSKELKFRNKSLKDYLTLPEFLNTYYNMKDRQEIYYTIQKIILNMV